MMACLWTFIELFVDLCASSIKKKLCEVVFNCDFVFPCGKLTDMREGVQLKCNNPTVQFYSFPLSAPVVAACFGL